MKKLYFSLIIYLLLEFNAFGQWEEIHLTDTLYFQYFGVHDLVKTNNNLIALAGPLFSSSNEGESWDPLPFEKEPHALFSTGQILFLNTDDGQFLPSTDDGKTWANIDYHFSYVNSFISDSNEIFIGTDEGIFKSQDNGVNWTLFSNGLPNDYYNSHVIPVTSLLINGSNIFAGTEYRGIYISTNDGNNWTSINDGLPEGEMDFPDFPVIENLANNETAVFASVFGKGIYRLLNGNNVWEKTHDGILENLVSSIICEDSMLFAVTTRAVYISHDNGSSWNELYSGFDSGGLSGIKMFDSNLYLYGIYAGLKRSSNTGITWMERNNGLGEFRIRYPNQIDVFNSVLGVISNDYKTFISTDIGDNWQNVTLNTTTINNYIENDTNFFNLFYAYLKKGGIWLQIYIDNGIDEIVLADTTLIWIERAGEWMWVRRGGITNGSIQDGIFYPIWKLSLNGSLNYNSLSVNGSNIYIGASDGVYLSSDFGGTWNQIGLKNKQIVNLVLSDTNLIAQAADGFYKSFDGGYNWYTLYLGLDNIVKLVLSGDNLIALTRAPDYSYYKLWKRSFNEIITGLAEEQIHPQKFYLSQNYPNPFNPSTKIKYSIPKISFVTLKIFDILGREISTLVNEEKPAGNYEVEFNGDELSSGIYFYKLQVGHYSEVKKMILMK